MENLEDIKKIIEMSGNSFHCEVVKYLKSKGWHSLISPYYLDSMSNKPREIDLVSEKAYPRIKEFPFGGQSGTINIKLFIECKYIPKEIVFWFDKKDIESTKKWVVSNTPLKENNMFTNQHHYIKSNAKVAKMFGSSTKPKYENEVIYKALNQCLHAIVYNKLKGSIVPINDGYHQNILGKMMIPVIVCNSFDHFYKVEIEDQNNIEKIDDNFQLEVNYAYLDKNGNHKNTFFLIDVVDYSKFDKFLSSIDGDAEAICQII